MTSPLDEAKSIDEILQLIWMDGAKLSGGSYANEPSMSAQEARSALKAILKEAVIGGFEKHDPTKNTTYEKSRRVRNKLRSEWLKNLDHLFNRKE